MGTPGLPNQRNPHPKYFFQAIKRKLEKKKNLQTKIISYNYREKQISKQRIFCTDYFIF